MSQTSELRNVVWISMESVRADHTSLHGYERETTPNLSRIASLQEAQSFDGCYSTAWWTPAATASIMTGTYLSTHTVGIHSPTVNTLPNQLDTLPDLLGDLGYDTFGMGNNAYITAGTGLDEGFDRFVDPHANNLHRTVGVRSILKYLLNLRSYGPGLTTDVSRHKLSPMITDATTRWLRSVSDERQPVFCYMHLNDTHYPYTPPKPFLAPFAEEVGMDPAEVLDLTSEVYGDVFQTVADGIPLSDREWDAIEAAYDADIAYVDHFIGQLFDSVRSELSRNTVFVVTSDHAELFGECGWLGHHVAPATDVFDVPLVVYGLPEIDHQADEIVQHVDLTRTLVESLGGRSSQFEGIDLTEETRDYAVAQIKPPEKDREKLLDRNRAFDADRYRFDAINCIWDDQFKLLVGDEGVELFELPDETTDIADDYPEVTAEMESALEEHLSELPDTERREPADFDSDTYDRLQDMGYI